MSLTELDTERLRAAMDTFRLQRNDLKVTMCETAEGRVLVTLQPRSWIEESAWAALLLPRQSAEEIRVTCSRATWAKMQAQVSK